MNILQFEYSDSDGSGGGGGFGGFDVEYPIVYKEELNIFLITIQCKSL